MLKLIFFILGMLLGFIIFCITAIFLVAISEHIKYSRQLKVTLSLHDSSVIEQCIIQWKNRNSISSNGKLDKVLAKLKVKVVQVPKLKFNQNYSLEPDNTGFMLIKVIREQSLSDKTYYISRAIADIYTNDILGGLRTSLDSLYYHKGNLHKLELSIKKYIARALILPINDVPNYLPDGIESGTVPVSLEHLKGVATAFDTSDTLVLYRISDYLALKNSPVNV